MGNPRDKQIIDALRVAGDVEYLDEKREKKDKYLRSLGTRTPSFPFSDVTPESKTETTPNFSREEYYRGNLGDDRFALADGGAPDDGASPDDYIKQLYQDNLGREPGKEEYGYWNSLLNQGQNIEDIIANSEEAQNNAMTQFVKDEYSGLMGREPTERELSIHLNDLKSGNITQDQFDQAISNSEESQLYQASNFEPYQVASKSGNVSTNQPRTAYQYSKANDEMIRSLPGWQQIGALLQQEGGMWVDKIMNPDTPQNVKDQAIKQLEGIANVVMNRAAVGLTDNKGSGAWSGWFKKNDPKNFTNQILAPSAFSAMKIGKTSLAKEGYNAINKAVGSVFNDPAYKPIADMINGVMNNTRPDITGGATHYKANYVHPGWAGGKKGLPYLTDLGGAPGGKGAYHQFYGSSQNANLAQQTRAQMGSTPYAGVTGTTPSTSTGVVATDPRAEYDRQMADYKKAQDARRQWEATTLGQLAAEGKPLVLPSGGPQVPALPTYEGIAQQLTQQGAGGNLPGMTFVNPLPGTTTNPAPGAGSGIGFPSTGWLPPATGTTSGGSVISPIPGTGLPQWDYSTGLTQNSPVYLGNTPSLPWQAGDVFAGSTPGQVPSSLPPGVYAFSSGGAVDDALRTARATGGGAWTRKEGKNPKGGLNEKGRASLRSQGHDIKRPQPEGGARKDSFCARMKGMKAKLTSSETANDPNSRINKSLRVWNCHSAGGAVDNALRLARAEGGPIDDRAHEFVREQLDTGEKQLPQYDPEAGVRTAKKLALDAYGMTDIGGAQEALGYMPNPEGGYEKSSLQRAKEGDYTGAALLAMGAIVPGAGKFGKVIREAKEPAEEVIRAYHGSPHKFDKFDISKIGSGEGAQAYGHGLYFAQNPAVAQEYRSRLAGRPEIKSLSIAGHRVGPFNSFDYSPKGSSNYENLRSSLFEDMLINEDALVADPRNAQKLASDILERKIKDLHEEWPEAVPDARRLLTDINRTGGVGLRMGETPGAMYEVDIHAPKEHLLDWDRPISEQSPIIQEFARAAKPTSPGSRSSVLLKKFQEGNEQPSYPLTGEQLHINLSRADNSPEISNKMREFGIPGIKYLDQGSRPFASGDGTSNYVVFDPDIIEILRRYAKGGAVDNAMRTVRASGGAIWDKPRPKSLGKPDPLTSKEKSKAKRMAKSAGRPYPNLIDSMNAAKKK